MEGVGLRPITSHHSLCAKQAGLFNGMDVSVTPSVPLLVASPPAFAVPSWAAHGLRKWVSFRLLCTTEA
eukprot:scaffold84349_cov17-Tisochrysis_lutea.AAC.1